MSDFKKSIEISAKLDTSSIGPSIQAMKRQFDEVAGSMGTGKAQSQTAARLNQQGYGSLMGMPKSEDIAKSKREMSSFIREQAQSQEKLYKIIENQKEKVEKLQSIKKSMLKDSKEELAIEEKKIAAKETLIRLNSQYQDRNKILNQALTLQSGNPNGPGGNPPPGGGTGGGSSGFGSFAKGIGAITSVIAGVATAVNTLAGFPMRLEEAKGTAVQSFVGRDVSAIQSGNAAFETPWMSERAKAAEMARTKRGWNAGVDRGLGAASALSIGIGGVLTATGVASPLGIGMMAGGAAGLYNDRNRSALFSTSQHNQLLNAQQGQDTLSIWDSLRKQDPMKGAAIDRLQGRYMGDLSSQRMMGMSDQGMFGAGGFQEGANRAGFNQDLAAAMATQIQGAGGSTRGMRGLTTLGMQASRGMDLTNAGSVLGRISGGAGGSSESIQVFRKVMEESIKAGLDKSDMREEQRRFADATSEILARSGVGTAEDASKTLQGFSKFLGENPTIRGIEGAKSAYQESQGFSAETSGRGGALQYAEMMKSPMLRQLGTRGMALVGEMPLEDLNSTNPALVAEATKIGVPVQDLIDELKNRKSNSMSNAVGLDRNKTNAMDKAMSGLGITGATSDQGLLDRSKLQNPDAFNEYVNTFEAGAIRDEYGGVQKGTAAFLGRRRGNLGPGSNVAGPANGGMDEELGRGTGRAGDEAVAASGQLAQSMLENFRNFKDAITPNTAALNALTAAIMHAQTTTGTPIPTRDAFGRYQKANPYLNQPQSGKPQGR